MVDVKLAGFSAPVKILEKLNEMQKRLETYFKSTAPQSSTHELTQLQSDIEKCISWFTPEPLAAAWARISRDPKDINALLEEALEDVPKARKSNETIIHGMGHHAAAHNAMFHYNITNASRLLVESIEARRLAGYLEKSQRYVTLDGDFVRPADFSLEDLAKFEQLVAIQNDFYFKTNEKILDMLKEKNKEKLASADDKARKKKLSDLEGSAKEDARYALSLATKAQLGASYDGEILEHAIRILKYGRLAEEREFAKKIFDEAAKYAPSLIQLADADIFRQRNPGQELDDNNYKNTRQNLRALVERTIAANRAHMDPPVIAYDCKVRENVALYRNNSADERVIAAILFANSKEIFANCLSLANHLGHAGQARNFVLEALASMGPYDKVPREFEAEGGLAYEIVISSCGFGQLKRHRMMTLLPQDYDTSLGITVPKNVEDAGAAGELRDVCDRSAELYNEFLQRYGKAAEYCLTNAHRRRALVGINTRELYHFSRTREDGHAQWEIRGIAGKMSELAKEVMPASTVLLGGKDKFNNAKGAVYGR
jgi:thymidylate synthase ThyX